MEHASKTAVRQDQESYPIVREFLRQPWSRRSPLARVFGLHPVPADIRPLYRGAVGEVAVAAALSQLGHGWVVLHAVPIGRDDTDIDHIVIGPPGIFTITIKNHAGSALWVGGAVFLVDGERVKHIKEAEFDAVRASQLLSDAAGMRAVVTPCVVVIHPRSLTVARAPRRVAVLTPRRLRPWLNSLDVVYSPEELASFSAAALRQETWTDHPRRSFDATLVTSFRARQREVHLARRLRFIWLGGLLLAVWTATMVAIGAATSRSALHALLLGGWL